MTNNQQSRLRIAHRNARDPEPNSVGAVIYIVSHSYILLSYLSRFPILVLFGLTSSRLHLVCFRSPFTYTRKYSNKIYTYSQSF